MKVLDFGLAKAAADDVVMPDLSQSPTVTIGGTQAGVILGTVAYMSPEQARGKPLDKRTDVWSFGCLLFEMLTGRRPFAGETVSERWRRFSSASPIGRRCRPPCRPAFGDCSEDVSRKTSRSDSVTLATRGLSSTTRSEAVDLDRVRYTRLPWEIRNAGSRESASSQPSAQQFFLRASGVMRSARPIQRRSP